MHGLAGCRPDGLQQLGPFAEVLRCVLAALPEGCDSSQREERPGPVQGKAFQHFEISLRQGEFHAETVGLCGRKDGQQGIISVC